MKDKMVDMIHLMISLIVASLIILFTINILVNEREQVVKAIIASCEKDGHFNFKDKTMHCIVTDRDQNEQTEKEAQKPYR